MKSNNPFDRKLDANKRIPEAFRGALVDCVDALDFCWAGVQSVFEGKARPEHALALIPIVLARADDLRQRKEAEWTARMADATTQAVAAKKSTGRQPKRPSPRPSTAP